MKSVESKSTDVKSIARMILHGIPSHRLRLAYRNVIEEGIVAALEAERAEVERLKAVAESERAWHIEVTGQRDKLQTELDEAARLMRTGQWPFETCKVVGEWLSRHAAK